MKNTYIVVLLLLVSACSTALNKKTVTAFNGYDLEKFIRERFVDHLSLANKFGLFLDRVLPLPSRGDANKQQEFNKKNFIHKAYFTRANNSYLTRPADDLSLFCQSSGGEFLRTKAFQKDYFVREDFYPVRYFYKVDDQLIGEMKMMLHSENMMPSDAKAAYADADNRGYFGDFTCRSNGQELWAVAIHPVGFAAKDNGPGANQLGNANLLLLQIMPLIIRGQ